MAAFTFQILEHDLIEATTATFHEAPPPPPRARCAASKCAPDCEGAHPPAVPSKINVSLHEGYQDTVNASAETKT